MSGIYQDVHNAIADHQTELGVDGDALRLLKLSEEVGEVAEAYIGYLGGNKRKMGLPITEIDVANELADVVITAMVALHDWVDRPEAFVKSRLVGLKERIAQEGS